MLVWTAVAMAQDDGGPPPVILNEERETAHPLDRDAKGFGIGLLLGLPTGLSGALRPEKGRAWYDAALAWNFDRSTLHLHVDALITLADLRTDDIPDVHFPVSIGVGPRLRLGDSALEADDELYHFGVRVPVGMSFIHDGLPLEGFLELAPGIGLYPATIGTFDAAIGGRYYF